MIDYLVASPVYGRATTGCGARSDSLWVHRNLFWHLSGNGNLHGSDMLHAMLDSAIPSFMAPWRVGDAVVGRGNAGGTTSKGLHPCPCQTAHKGLLQERLGQDLC